jgi:energy-coupling factor transport system ATP-binding protein
VSYIKIANVGFRYPESTEDSFVLNNINLSIQEGEFVCLIGANSSGKSTLGRLMNAILIPTIGDVIIDESLNTKESANTIQIRQRVGMIFQNPDNQIVATTVEEEVAFGPENLNLKSEEIIKLVDNALNEVGLTEYRSFPPHLLSGGQKQLLAIASVLAMEPKCIVFDEPTSLLDPFSRELVINKIIEINKKGKTIVLITHRMEEVLLSNRVIVLKDGLIEIDAPPKDVFSMSDEALVKLNLYPPEIVQIINKLRKSGFDIPKNIISSKDLIDYICQ